MNSNGKSKKSMVFSMIILLIVGVITGVIFAAHNNNKAIVAENMKNNDKKIEESKKIESEVDKNEEEAKIKDSELKEDKDKKVPQQKDSSGKKVEDKNQNENKNAKITKEQAQKIVEEFKEKEWKISYIGIEKVPYDYINTPYTKFPKEILNKEVYVFELTELVDKKNNESITVCRCYVDFNGGLYKDTYFMNLECVKVK